MIVVEIGEDVDRIIGKWFFGSLISIWTCAHVLFLVRMAGYDKLFLS